MNLRFSALILAILWLVSAASSASLATQKFRGGDASPELPSSPLNLQEARDYMLLLINRDRAQQGLNPLKLDLTACAAAQLHSDTMAKLLFNSHWHPDGQKPPQRYAGCGGFDYVMENSHGCGEQSGFTSSISEEQVFSRDEIEKEEQIYFAEKPPMDGHRRNILDPAHTHVGLGMTLVTVKWTGGEVAGADTFRELTSAQEFINKRAKNLSETSTKLERGKAYSLSGELDPGCELFSAAIQFEPMPRPIALEVLQDNHEAQYHGGYTVPQQRFLDIFPLPCTQTPQGRLTLEGNRFSLEFTPGKDWESGLYYITLWAQSDSRATKPQPISLHPVPLE